LTTEKNGSVAADQCRIKPGWGIKTFIPLEAEMCNNNRYGDPAMRPVVASARCVPCAPNLFTMDVLQNNITTTGYTSEQVSVQSSQLSHKSCLVIQLRFYLDSAYIDVTVQVCSSYALQSSAHLIPTERDLTSV
jgi:hypothetical protein